MSVDESSNERSHWTPNPGPQTAFARSTTYEVLYGGAAGGGKSSALVGLASHWREVPHFRALILRRETTQLNDLLDKAHRIYRPLGGVYKSEGHRWIFPSGAVIRFNHCKEERDAYDYQGQEFQLVCFDELTHFAERQYLEICSRVRSTDPKLPRMIRATSNPGGPGHEWVLKRFAPWLDPTNTAFPPRIDPRTGDPLPPLESGSECWVRKLSSGEVFTDKPSWRARTRTFIAARLQDNPQLLANDAEYASRLRDLDPVRRAQLLEGNWLVKPAAGDLFKRGWFEIVAVAPADARRVRYWDRAATEGAGDWTRGVKLARAPDGLWYVEHVISLRGRPREVEQTIRGTAESDGKHVLVGIEQDPGQAGKFEAESYVRQLAGFDVRSYPVTRDKITRARPVSAQAEARNIRLVRGDWNEAFLDELEAFPDGSHDDQVDALSGAFAALTNVKEPAAWDVVRVPSTRR